MMRAPRGFTMEEAWRVAMRPGASSSVADFEGGGYAVPVARGAMRPPERAVPIAAIIPAGRVWILPAVSAGGVWRLFRPGRPRCPKCHGTSSHRCRSGDPGCRHCDDCQHTWFDKE